MVLQVNNIHTYYGQAHILQGVSLEVGAGEVVGLVGRNGAGKSTTLKSIMGLVPIARGEISWNGRVIASASTRQRPDAIAREGLGYVPEDRRIFTKLTVLENLEVGAKAGLGNDSSWTVQRVLELFPALVPLQAREGGQLSGGEQQMLTIARTLMGNPRVLLLDEPTEGLAPIVVEQVVAAIAQLKAMHLSVLISGQNHPATESLCDRQYAMEKGRIVPASPGT